MANIKSSKKRIKVAESKRLQNQSKKSEIKTFTKKFNNAIASKEVELATELQNKCYSLLDSAAQDNVIHQNKANRQKARMAAQLTKASA